MTKREALHPRDPELLDLIQRAGRHARDVAWFAAVRALASARVSDPPVPVVLDAIRTLEPGDAFAQRPLVADLVERLDDEYWEASEAKPQDEARVLMAFRRARAANALLASLDPDAARAALEAVYEACHAFPESEAGSFVDEAKDKLRHYAGLS